MRLRSFITRRNRELAVSSSRRLGLGLGVSALTFGLLLVGLWVARAFTAQHLPLLVGALLLGAGVSAWLFVGPSRGLEGLRALRGIVPASRVSISEAELLLRQAREAPVRVVEQDCGVRLLVRLGLGRLLLDAAGDLRLSLNAKGKGLVLD